MPEHPTIVVIAPEPSKLAQTLMDNKDLQAVCGVISIPSISVIAALIDTSPGLHVPIVIVDYNAVTEGMGGNDQAVSTKDRLAMLKTHGLRNGHGPRVVIGVSGLEPFIVQLKGFGCDQTCSESTLPAIIESCLKRSGAS